MRLFLRELYELSLVTTTLLLCGVLGSTLGFCAAYFFILVTFHL